MTLAPGFNQKYSKDFLLQHFTHNIDWFQFDYLRRDWRLSYINLRGAKNHKNSIPTSQRQDLWIPLLTFDNCIKDYFVKLDELASFTVKRIGNTSWSFNANLLEENKFDGESNDLIYARVYKLVFQCEFELHSYPFDKQTCLIIVSRSLKANLSNFLINWFLMMTNKKLVGIGTKIHNLLSYHNPFGIEHIPWLVSFCALEQCMTESLQRIKLTTSAKFKTKVDV